MRVMTMSRHVQRDASKTTRLHPLGARLFVPTNLQFLKMNHMEVAPGAVESSIQAITWLRNQEIWALCVIGAIMVK